MNDMDRLVAHIVPIGSGGDFMATQEGGLALIEPLHPDARQWLVSSVDPDAIWEEGSLVVEMRYFANLVDAIIAAGFVFEAEASVAAAGPNGRGEQDGNDRI